MLERLRAVGVRYFALTHYDLWWLDHYRDFQAHLDSLYKRVREEDEYIIFDLTPIQHGDRTRLMKKTEPSWNSGEGGSLQGKHCGCPVAGYQCLGPR
jgi:hypothetical protein